ncbi:aspartyl/glutamyl-tRNA amidotransferase subunit C, partial [Streptococcus suis]
MKISEAEVRHVAKLSKLDFSDQDTAEVATSLSKIVDLVELLHEV